jgi:hypothetical protein
MGDFRIVINAVGGHGQDRDKKDGEVVNFSAESSLSPEALAEKFVKELKESGCSVQDAKVIHWPIDNYPDQRTSQIEDDLVTGVRKGNF